jgi:pimeloyl-ACP methyl ester carboxylesterase
VSRQIKHDQVAFTSEGVELDGWHFTGVGPAFDSPDGRPVVVMAHGLGGTKDSGLEPFATALAEAGLDVLAFDYRGFGASGGTPRQRVSMTGQLEDYHAAMAAAARLPGVDGSRLVLWGASVSGGHVLAAAVGRDDVAAVVSLAPLVDGRAAGRLALKHHSPGSILRSTGAGIRSRISGLRGGAPVLMPIVAHPGEVGALTLSGHYEAYLAIAGPTWRNEIDAAVGLELGAHRPARHAGSLRCPVLVQIADFDRSAPPRASVKAAAAARAEVRHYPCDHFDVWPGSDWFEPALAHQLHFLRRHLAVG